MSSRTLKGAAQFGARHWFAGSVAFFFAVTLSTLVALAQPAGQPAAFCPIGPGVAPGVDLLEVTDGAFCTAESVIGRVPSNAAETVTSLDGTIVHLVYSDDADQSNTKLVTLVDGFCENASKVSIEPAEGNASHDAPSVFVDGEGYVYVAYHGDTYNLLGPLLRKSREPGVPQKFGPEHTSRTYSGAEVHGFTGRDGAVYIVSHNTSTRLDVIEPNGTPGDISFRHGPGPLQVIASDSGEIPISGCSLKSTKYNRFTKGYITEAVRSDGSTFLIALWGWGGDRSGPACKDVRHYGEDSHEVFFAYSEDEGRTWWNREGTTSRVAEHCTESSGCPGLEHGIVMNDPAFILTRTRQREFRAAHYDPATDTVYAAFAKSLWCNKGACLSKSVKDPGALMFLSFQLDSGFVVERKISSGNYQFIAAITKGGGGLHVYAGDGGDLYDHVSTDDGVTWNRSRIDNFGRPHGVGSLPCSPSTALVAGAANGDPLMYYRRTFADSGGSPPPPAPPPPAPPPPPPPKPPPPAPPPPAPPPSGPGPLSDAQQDCVVRVDKEAGRLVKAQGKLFKDCLKNAIGEKLDHRETFESCVAASGAKVDEAEILLRLEHSLLCRAGGLPAFGQARDPDALVQSTLQSAHALTEDVYGMPAAIVTKDSDPASAKCQEAVMKAQNKVAGVVWAESGKAKKSAVGGKGVSARNAGDLADAVRDQLAQNKKLDKELVKLDAAIAKSCSGGVSGLFPGLCNHSNPNVFGACVAQRALCRACQGADATGGLGLDCEAISGGLCP